MLNSKLCRLLTRGETFAQLSVLRSKATSKRILNQDLEESLPVYQYASPHSDKQPRVYVWGMAEHGALGEAELLRPTRRGKYPVKYMHRPYRLRFSETNEVNGIAAGYGFSIFSIKTKNQPYIFGVGLNTDSQIGYHAVRRDKPLEMLIQPVPINLSNVSSSITSLDCGRAHTVVLTAKNGVFTLGHNGYGQCGRKIIECEDYQRQSTIHQIKTEEQFTSVVCGQDHTLLLTKKGEVYACGWGADGQTGVGHYRNTDRITKCVGDIDGEKIVKVSCSADCVLALNERGDVFGWGNSEYGQFKMITDEMQLHTPRHLNLLSNCGKIVDVAASATGCLALNESGEVFVWGYGILGVGPSVEQTAKPTKIPHTLFEYSNLNTESQVVSIFSGLNQFAAVTNSGDLYMWGRNKYGSLGLGHLNNQFFPIKVNVPGFVQKVSIGVDHCIALCKSYV